MQLLELGQAGDPFLEAINFLLAVVRSFEVSSRKSTRLRGRSEGLLKYPVDELGDSSGVSSSRRGNWAGSKLVPVVSLITSMSKSLGGVGGCARRVSRPAVTSIFCRGKERKDRLERRSHYEGLRRCLKQVISEDRGSPSMFGQLLGYCMRHVNLQGQRVEIGPWHAGALSASPSPSDSRSGRRSPVARLQIRRL